MLDVALYRLSIPFAIVTGTGAGILAVLSWEVLRDSPFGTPLKLLVLVMVIVTAYHGGLVVSGSETLVLQSLLILGYILVLIALFTAVSELGGELWANRTFKHQSVFLATIAGLLLYGVGGPISELFFPPVLHWVHGVAGLFAIAGLYSPVHDDLNKSPWEQLLLDESTDGRRHAEWMVPMDDGILDVLYSSSLVLSPVIIAYNTEYSREEVNRRLTKLEANGFVERVERGKYRLAARGERYVEREFTSST